MMQFDDTMLHVLLYSLAVAAKHCSISMMTVALNPGLWTMTTTGAWTDVSWCFFCSHWECIDVYRSSRVTVSHVAYQTCAVLTGLDGIPYRSFLLGSKAHTCWSLWWVTTLSSHHLWTRHDFQSELFFARGEWWMIKISLQVQFYGCQWRWTSPFRWILQMGRLEETESWLKFLANIFFFFTTFSLTSFFDHVWAFPKNCFNDFPIFYLLSKGFFSRPVEWKGCIGITTFG